MELKKYITKGVKCLSAIKLEEENFNDVMNLVNGVKKYYSNSESYYLSYVTKYNNVNHDRIVHLGDYIIKINDDCFSSMFAFCFEDMYEVIK